MPDRLPHVLSYVQQQCRTIPCRKGTKHASLRWERYQHEDPSRVDLHRWWDGTRQNDANIALVLGPPPGGNLLALNVNVKNGYDGPATLARLGWTLPPTPTIRTPSHGLCYFFRVPDPAQYPFTFDTHVHPDGYAGLEFRGTGGYQLVPTSRTAEGVYAFVSPWTLERFRADLAELPGVILQAWARLDQRAARNFGQNFARHNRQSSQTRTTPATAHSPDFLPPPKSAKRSQVRAPQTAPTTTPTYTTITTVLTADDDRVFVDGFDVHEQEAAEALCDRLSLSVDSLSGRFPFACRLPGHGPDRDPSATWARSTAGYYLYKDWHERSQDKIFTVPEVFAALVTRKVRRLPKPSQIAWRLRLLVKEGILEPEPVRMRAVPDDASHLLRHYCEGFRLLVACKSCHPKTLINAATPFTRGFAADWCGLPRGSIWTAHQEALKRDLLVFAGLYKGQALYRPGKED